MLPELRPAALTAFCASATQRSLREAPVETGHDVVFSPPVVLDALWRLADEPDDAASFEVLSQSLAEHLRSPYWHNLGQDGPSDADRPEISVALYSCVAALFGATDCALQASAVLVEDAMNRAEAGGPLEWSTIEGHPIVQGELRVQTDALDLLATVGDDFRHDGKRQQTLLRLGRP